MNRSYNNTATFLNSEIFNNQSYNDIATIIGNIAPNTTPEDTAFLSSPTVKPQISALEDMFDMQVKEYIDYFQETQNAAFVTSEVMHQENLRRSAEANKNLGTGQSAIVKEALDISKEQTDLAIQTSVAESLNEAVTTTQNAFAERLSQIFGGVTDGRFNQLIEYSEFADEATNALLFEIANDVFTGRVNSYLTGNVFGIKQDTLVKTYASGITADNVMRFLSEADVGILALDMESGGYYLTDKGFQYLDATLNSEIAANDGEGRTTIYDRIAERMLEFNFDTDKISNMSESKKLYYLNQYKDFLADYSQEWRYTHLGLYDVIDGNIIIDTYYYSGEYETPTETRTESSKPIDDIFDDAVDSLEKLPGTLEQIADNRFDNADKDQDTAMMDTALGIAEVGATVAATTSKAVGASIVKGTAEAVKITNNLLNKLNPFK